MLIISQALWSHPWWLLGTDVHLASANRHVRLLLHMSTKTLTPDSALQIEASSYSDQHENTAGINGQAQGLSCKSRLCNSSSHRKNNRGSWTVVNALMPVLLFKNIYVFIWLFIWLHWVLFAAQGVFCCSEQASL